MTRRRLLTDKMIAALPHKATRYSVADPQLGGLFVRVPTEGPSVFYVVARTPGGRAGKKIWHKLGTADALTIAEAREQAREVIKRIRSGQSPVAQIPAKPDDFESVARNWIKRHVVAKNLRTRPAIEWCLAKYVYPQWGRRDFVGIKRSDMAALMDYVEDHHGKRQAQIVRSHVSSIATWFAGRHDTYSNPFRDVKYGGLVKRSRNLDDDELQRVWKQADQAGSFGALIKILLLAGQRRGATLSMRWDDISDDGMWTIPHDPRMKPHAGSLKLPAMALKIIRAQPRLASNPHVFAASRGDGPMGGFSPAKLKFDKACNVRGWTLHDLRRCARSLMSRCGVRPDIAERVLGHVVGGTIGQTYDRFGYDAEKAAALESLATLVDMIVNDRRAKVVQIRGRK